MKTIIGTSGFEYTDGQTPEERLRNILSPIFTSVELSARGDCNVNVAQVAEKLLPEVVEHLGNIEEFYTNREDNTEN